MGALHKGHLSLVKRALYKSDVCVVSIYVNPTQFNNAKDLEGYPRTVESDIQMLRHLSEDIIVYLPTNEDIYGDAVELNDFNFMGLDKIMEGANRPGHFKGVANVVERLFDAVQPKFAFFGEKDFQQVAVIRQMVNSLSLPIQIKTGKTIRDNDGLAKSSRNTLLSTTQRKKATYVYASLQKIKSLF